MTTATTFTVTVSRNSIGGQWYIERSDQPESNIRVPYSRVADYASEGGVGDYEISALENGGVISAGGDWAIALWELAEQYEG